MGGNGVSRSCAFIFLVVLVFVAFTVMPAGAKVLPWNPSCPKVTMSLSNTGITMTGLEKNNRIVLMITLSGMKGASGEFTLQDARMPFLLKDNCDFCGFGYNMKKLVFTETDEYGNTRGVEGTGTKTVYISKDEAPCPCTGGKKDFSVSYEVANSKKSAWISMYWKGVVGENKPSFTVPFTIDASTKGTAFVSLTVWNRCGIHPFFEKIKLK